MEWVIGAIVLFLGLFVFPFIMSQRYQIKDLERIAVEHRRDIVDLWRDLHILQKQVKNITGPVVTDKPVVLAEEPQLDDSVYRVANSFSKPKFDNGYPAWDTTGIWRAAADKAARERVNQYG